MDNARCLMKGNITAPTQLGKRGKGCEDGSGYYLVSVVVGLSFYLHIPHTCSL